MLSVKDRTLVLSDVDGTILRGSLVINHACYLHDKGIIDLGDLPARWLADVKNEEVISLIAESYCDEIKGMKESEIETESFVADFVTHPENFYSVIGDLFFQSEAGADVFLISGSPDFLLKHFARHFGFAFAGSKYLVDADGRFTGEVEGMFGADAKQKFVAQLPLLSYSHIIAFGDTASDKPMLDVADHKVLVAPTQATLSRYGAVDMVLSR